jgi:signal transduction histidine kinase
MPVAMPHDIRSLVGTDGPSRPRGLGLLRVPLVAKLAGANALIVIAAWIATEAVNSGRVTSSPALVLAISLGLSLLVNVALVLLALRPLQSLERAAEEVWAGNLEARVPDSPLADSQVRRIGQTLNALLDRLLADRQRLRDLTTQVIAAGDRERAGIARELHDSTAQTLAAITYELTVASSETHDPEQLERLERVRSLANQVLDEVRLLSRTVHPRVLDDLGLSAALRTLVRETADRTGLEIDVTTDELDGALPTGTATVLYRVAQTALANAVAHADASHIRLRLSRSDGHVRLAVEDDGRGFDVARAESERAGMGLFSMRERMALADGSLSILSAPDAGTRVVADIPLTTGLPR